jgi:hypothetical protein
MVCAGALHCTAINDGGHLPKQESQPRLAPPPQHSAEDIDTSCTSTGVGTGTGTSTTGTVEQTEHSAGGACDSTVAARPLRRTRSCHTVPQDPHGYDHYWYSY